MATKTDKVPMNVGGKYYVDSACIACGLCTSLAPQSFKMNDDGDYAYVFQQPEGAASTTACEEALEQCPVEAIGNDG